MIYVLDKVLDDPRFEGFGVVEAPSLLGRDSRRDDLTPGFGDASKNPRWQQPSLCSHWIPPQVIGRVSEFNDYPCLGMILPVFSERAVDRLRPMLEANGELLLLDSNTKTRFFFYNIRTISDALDQSRSKCHFWCDPPTTAMGIDRFEFQKTKLAGLSIFRIHQDPALVLVTEEFVDQVNFFGLRGFDFKKVWPLPPGVNWEKQKSQSDRDRKRLKQHTLVIIFPFNGSPKDKKTISTFENLVERRLKVVKLEDPYLGFYEGNDQVEYDYRMFLSAPNVDALFDFLRDDIEALNWPKPVRVFRRYGEMYDENAKEEMSEIY